MYTFKMKSAGPASYDPHAILDRATASRLIKHLLKLKAFFKSPHNKGFYFTFLG